MSSKGNIWFDNMDEGAQKGSGVQETRQREHCSPEPTRLWSFHSHSQATLEFTAEERSDPDREENTNTHRHTHLNIEMALESRKQFAGCACEISMVVNEETGRGKKGKSVGDR